MHLIELADDHRPWFICADWHIPPNSQHYLWQMFCDLLDALAARACHLLVMGDWLSLWLGPDWGLPHYAPLFQKVAQFASSNSAMVAWQPGNRDFGLARMNLNPYHIQIWPEQTVLITRAQRVLVTHGDEWCLEDKNYQRLRRIIRQNWLGTCLLHTPLSWRLWLAHQLKNDVRIDHPSSYAIDALSVLHAAAAADSHLVVHGHIHRPQVVHHDSQVKRLVVGDWHQGGGIGCWWQDGDAPILVRWDQQQRDFAPFHPPAHPA